MKHSTRRRLDVFLLGLGAVAVGVVASIGALVGDTERIADYWLHASVDDGSAQVVEVIDYDFGVNRRHGILRDIPDVDPRTPVTISSPTAPDTFIALSQFGGVRWQVGDPDTTISNRHRYQLSYPIESLIVGDRLSWNAVGLDWTVPISHAEIHVTADREFSEIACHRGQSGDRGGCEVTQVDLGHLLVVVDGLDPGEAVTVEGTLGAAIAQAPRVIAAIPQGEAVDPGSGWLAPGLAALAAALVAGAVTSRRVRTLGKEQVWSGGAADAAFGPLSGDVAGVELVDHRQLDEMASIEFASPQGLSAAAGGIIHAEGVKPEHQIAWLIECAIRDEVRLEEHDDDFVLLRGPADPHPAVVARLDAIFAGGARVELGEYDSGFASAWNGLATELEEWRAASGLWDPRGHKRRTSARVFGTIGALAGVAVAVLGAVVANRAGPAWLVLCVLGALLAGASLAALIRSWELPIRTPEGSARWIQIESFRRFIAASEARHAEAAAQMGLLRHYTAWAVALGELGHWKKSVDAATKVPGSAVSRSGSDYHFVTMAPAFSSATASTFTAPSSSSGGGGGGAGGGGGGGGGGSW